MTLLVYLYLPLSSFFRCIIGYRRFETFNLNSSVSLVSFFHLPFSTFSVFNPSSVDVISGTECHLSTVEPVPNTEQPTRRRGRYESNAELNRADPFVVVFGCKHLRFVPLWSGWACWPWFSSVKARSSVPSWECIHVLVPYPIPSLTPGAEKVFKDTRRLSGDGPVFPTRHDPIRHIGMRVPRLFGPIP